VRFRAYFKNEAKKIAIHAPNGINTYTILVDHFAENQVRKKSDLNVINSKNKDIGLQ
jgi:hypothetical protein